MVVEVCDTIECLSDSPQRLRILDALDGRRTDLRDLMDQLDSPRSTLQRNLSVLAEQDWIEKTASGYTTTTAGCLLLEGVVRLNETVETVRSTAVFLETIDTPSEVDMGKLNDPRVTIPETEHPSAPTKRLLSVFGKSDFVRGLLPVVSSLSIERSRRNEAERPKLDCVLSSDAFDALCAQYVSGDADEIALEPPAHITVRAYGGALPYGLFVSNETLALTAYNEVGRIQALVESTSEETIEWGEQVYEKYRRQSERPHETNKPNPSHDSERVD